jgi:competence protein ComFC
VVKFDPKSLDGRWVKGVALDVHTISSTHVGVDQYGRDQFETEYSPLGELLYRLKYKGDASAAPEIVAAAVKFLRPNLSKFDIIVPVPPSNQRAVQPVPLLANGIGRALGVPVWNCVSKTKSTAALKGVLDPEKRKEVLQGVFEVDAKRTARKNILLFDDLYRSGTTLNEICDVLMDEGRAESVRVLTITKTRSNR